MPIVVRETYFSHVLLIEPRRYEDDRGFFEETWSERDFGSETGLDVKFVQDNYSYSLHAETIRGLHLQAPPHAQDKLIRCSQGSIFDVAVDVRVGSSTYGQWVGLELSRDNGLQLFIPKGFLHGFITLEPDTEVHYKCSNFYNAESERSVLWDSLPIRWPNIKKVRSPSISQKDKEGVAFESFHSPFAAVS